MRPWVHGPAAYAVALAVAWVGASCSGDKAPAKAAADAPAVPKGEPLSKTTASGPVKATVTVTPKQAKLGDNLSLTLRVEAEPGTSVQMPEFGEVLGRFTIARFTPRRTVAPSGNTVHEQVYLLQAPMSGRKRIPPLRIEFTPKQSAPAAATGAGKATATKPADDPTRELLTEELPVTIDSVLPADSVGGELRPPLENLALGHAQSIFRRWTPALIAGGLLLLLGVVFLVARRRKQVIRRASAYDIAMKQLTALEHGGYPAPEEADAWYVAVSDAVRQYLENRFEIRAPEQTTEEFLRKSETSDEFSAEQRETLGEFLASCDRVKFAGYLPGEGESRAALELARAFVTNTRLVELDEPEKAAA